MQGDTEYYDSNFFHPFFIQLDEDKKNKYYKKYNAESNWEERLKIFYEGEESL